MLASTTLVTRIPGDVRGRTSRTGGCDDGGDRRSARPSSGSLGHAEEDTGGYTCGRMRRLSKEREIKG